MKSITKTPPPSPGTPPRGLGSFPKTPRPRLGFLAVAVLASGLSLAGPAAAAEPVPAQVLDLADWKLALPTGPLTKSTHVAQPELATFSLNPWFTVNSAGDGVRFRAPVACTTKTGPACGSTTSTNTSYARSELREMTNRGSTEAAWDMNTGTHTFEATLAFLKLPSVKPQVVGMQVHDGSDDVTTIRLDGTKLWVSEGDSPRYKLLTDRYSLGTKFTVKYVAGGGKIKIYYNGSRATTIASNAPANYFKVGAYTQANCDNSTPCDGNVNYGEVHVYRTRVTHQ